MESIKVGKFISDLRRDKNMTQKELADKLNVTDKAISRWETGKGYPDITIIDKLAKELDVNVADLLNGEKLNNKGLNSEETISIVKETIDYSNNEIIINKKKIKRNSLIIITGLILILIIFVMWLTDYLLFNNGRGVLFARLLKVDYYGIDKQNNIEYYYGIGYKVIKYNSEYGRNDSEFGSWFLKEKNINIDEDVAKDINKYIESLNENTRGLESYKNFVATRIIGTNDITIDTLEVYLWCFERGYYIENGELKIDNNSSMPYKMTLKKGEDGYEVVKYEIPKDGSLYNDSMNKLFPKSVLRVMNDIYSTNIVNKLVTDIKEQAKTYYNMDKLPLY